jgi:integrase
MQHEAVAAERADHVGIFRPAIVRLLYVGAMRRAEVTGLQVAHVALEHADGPAILAKRKGSKERQPVLVSARCAEALAAWLRVRGTEPGPLFTRQDRARSVGPAGMTGEAVRRMLRARTKEAGIRGTIRPHGLRHSAATQVAGCASLGTLMAVGGWKSLSAAQNYIDKRQEERRRGLAILEV